jgi:hypothetical protein
MGCEEYADHEKGMAMIVHDWLHLGPIRDRQWEMAACGHQ